MAVDVEKIMVDIFTDNWKTSNTNGVFPDIFQITDKKKHNLGFQPDVVLVGVFSPEQVPAGVGAKAKHTFFTGKIDIRTKGNTSMDRKGIWLDLIAEVRRILDVKIVNPDDNFLILDGDGLGTNLSDGAHNVLRMVIPVKLERYAEARGT